MVVTTPAKHRWGERGFTSSANQLGTETPGLPVSWSMTSNAMLRTLSFMLGKVSKYKEKKSKYKKNAKREKKGKNKMEDKNCLRLLAISTGASWGGSSEARPQGTYLQVP